MFKHNMTQLLPPSIYRATCVAGLEHSLKTIRVDDIVHMYCETIPV